ncbi:unnamed protein product [Musa textilis]
MRRSLLAALLLCLALLLLLLRGPSTLQSSHANTSSIPRKMLLAKPDVAAISHARHHHHHHYGHQHRHNQSQKTSLVDPSGGDEIDPRYGVEKRLVPTGPNPLHH